MSARGLASPTTIAVPRRLRLPALVVALAPLGAALTAWALSLSAIDVSSPSDYGLPAELPVSWYAALAALLCGAACATWVDRPNAWLVAGYLGAIVLVLYATVPAVADAPQYAWTYKHIGVTRLLELTGATNPDIDIYNRWPGFFALAAAFSRLSGVDPLSYAAWAEPFFAMVNALLVAAIANVVVRDARVAGFATLLFVITNWVGQGYFAPQALAFTLDLALLLVVFRELLVHGRETDRLKRLLEFVTRRKQDAALAAPRLQGRPASITYVLLFDAAIVATHQLTPYVVLLQVGALTALGIVRPRWLVMAMGMLTIAYLLPNLDYITKHFGLFTGLNPFGNAQHEALAPLQRNWLNAHAGKLLFFVLACLATAATVRLSLMKSGWRALPLAVLAAAPFAVLLGQNYGGEASLRIFLFSSPWLCMLIAWGAAEMPRRLRLGGALAASAVLAALFVPAFFGRTGTNIIPRSEVQASEYFYAHAPAGSSLVYAGTGFPLNVGPRYPLMRDARANEIPNVLENPALRDHKLGPRDVPAVIALIRRQSPRGYLVFSTSQRRYSSFFKFGAPGSLRSLEFAVASSGRFRLWHATRDARIYQLVVPSARRGE